VRANYHTHSDFCDGKAAPAVMARAAREAGYDILGFSAHAPFPKGMDCAIKPERLAEYAAEIRRLGRAWSPEGEEGRLYGPMEILLGLEIDWFPPESAPNDGRFSELGLDYCLGSVHFVEVDGAPPFAVDTNEDHFAHDLARARVDIRTVYRDYFSRLGALIDSGGFDILGHFDLVKKNNRRARYFDEASDDYLAAALAAADRLAGKDIVVEINVGGMARGKTLEPYPSLAILRRIRELGLRITIGADAHEPRHFGLHLEAARDLATAAGYRSVAVLTKGSWIETGMDEIQERAR
jgi:histidinol-phosphatase (PHP family)